MHYNDLLNRINKTDEEIKNIINNSVSLSQAAREILDTDSTLARSIIKDICEKNGYDEPRWFNRTRNCLYCGKEIIGGDNRKKFCNHSCAASYNNIGVSRNTKQDSEIFCLNCGNPIKKGVFCNRKCKEEYQYNNYIERWKKGEEDGLYGKYTINKILREYLLKKCEYKCSNCGKSYENPYTHKTILQIHHKDGDCTNNKEDNLEVLCPNCHAMTENFGSRNKNCTRIDKRKRY